MFAFGKCLVLTLLRCILAPCRTLTFLPRDVLPPTVVCALLHSSKRSAFRQDNVNTLRNEIAMTFTEKAEASYEPLADSDEDAGVQGRCSLSGDRRRLFSARTSLIHLVIIVVEIIFACVLVGGSIFLGTSCRARHFMGHLDGLSELGAYNTTMRFDNYSHLLQDSVEAKSYWGKLLQTGGVLSLDTEWALKQGLRPSAESPTDPSQSIYQVDVFHALHCLVRWS
jgi:hypothetical protein